MHVLLSALGSSGDVEPFLALAQGLIAAGHRPLLATAEKFAQRASALGVPFVRIGPDWDEAHVRQHFAEVLARRNPLRQLAMVTNELAELQLPEVENLTALVRDADVVVYAPLAIATVAAARKLGKPHVSVHFAPLHRADNYSPTGSDFGRFGNRIVWSLSSALLRRATDASLNRIVSAVGLPPWYDILLRASHSTQLDLIAVSQRVLTRDPSWGPATHMTGYWFVDEATWVPDPALEQLTRQTPPVVIGFGSMMGLDARETTAWILEAVASLDRPVVIQAGWAGLGAGALPRHVHAVGFVPHAWLFQRAACVVHHGGAGTTAAALRAGVPQAIVPHLGDQPIWARKIAELGLGPKPRARHAADARWLRRAIERMLADVDMRARAERLGVDIRAENGVTNAVRAIESHARAGATGERARQHAGRA
jgi:sterol 3beta-glucosyltransferase